MTIICSWCTAYMGEKDGEGVTHGICRTCAEKMKAEALRLRNIYAVEDAMGKEARHASE